MTGVDEAMRRAIEAFHAIFATPPHQSDYVLCCPSEGDPAMSDQTTDELLDPTSPQVQIDRMRAAAEKCYETARTYVTIAVTAERCAEQMRALSRVTVVDEDGDDVSPLRKVGMEALKFEEGQAISRLQRAALDAHGRGSTWRSFGDRFTASADLESIELREAGE